MIKDTNKAQSSVVSIGVVSLITVFAVLLLASFSLLILSSSRQDKELSLRTAQTVTDYYIADATAEETIAKVDAIRLNILASEEVLASQMGQQQNEQPQEGEEPENTSDTPRISEDYLKTLFAEKLINEDYQVMTGEQYDSYSGVVVSFYVPIDDNKDLYVEVLLPLDANQNVHRITWQSRVHDIYGAA